MLRKRDLGRTDRRKDGWTEGQTDGQTDHYRAPVELGPYNT